MFDRGVSDEIAVGLHLFDWKVQGGDWLALSFYSPC
jgi:hypothetical protein